MSLGFSVGDILGGASLAYKLCKALSDTKGSSRDYQQLIAELNVVHKVLIQVEQLRVSNQLAQATLNALLFITNSANEAIEVFLADHEKYTESFKRGGSGNMLKDSWRKGKWAFEMEIEKSRLRQTLANMLVSINCLVQLACFFNTGYRPEVGAKFSITGTVDEHKERPYVFSLPFNDVKLEACISYSSFWIEREPSERYYKEWGATEFKTYELSTDFKVQHRPLEFFRSGQVFSLCISSDLSVHHTGHRRIKLSQLPLEPIADLKAKYERTRKADREKRPKQILSLPLAEMIPYSKESENGEILCILCHGSDSKRSHHKDLWVDVHFRLEHWTQYCIMRGINLMSDTDKLPSIESYLKYKSRPSMRQPTSAISSNASPANWISIGDITSDWPIREDWEIREMVNRTTQSSEPHIPGISIIRRFIVIQEGPESCLCLGIHTYAGLGCSTQTDQELFAILHSSKEVSPPLEKEIGMTLAPIRMKPEHPSTALPLSTRIHFGRAYVIGHKMPVKSLGLIHAGSMQKLISQSAAHVYKNGSGSNLHRNGSGYNLQDLESWLRGIEEPTDQHIIPADMEIVRSMRSSIMDVLGRNISLSSHPAPEEPPLGLASLSNGTVDSESSGNMKCAKFD